MLSMDSREMRLMYKAFNEWQKNTLAFIKKGNETVPCNIIDKGLFETTVCFDGEYGFYFKISDLLDNNAAEIENLISQYDCLDCDFEMKYLNTCKTKIDNESKTIVIEFRQYDDMLGIPSSYLTDKNGNIWRSSNKEDWEKYPEYFYHDDDEEEDI